MREVVWEWREAVGENRITWVTFENQVGERVRTEMTDVFDPRYAKLHDLVEG